MIILSALRIKNTKKRTSAKSFAPKRNAAVLNYCNWLKFKVIKWGRTLFKDGLNLYATIYIIAWMDVDEHNFSYSLGTKNLTETKSNGKCNIGLSVFLLALPQATDRMHLKLI